MKIKAGSVLKVRFEGVNHYVQIINIQIKGERLQIQIQRGKTVNINKDPKTGWSYENPQSVLDDGLLEQIGQAIDKCSFV